jgi:mannosyltransferase
MTLVDVTVEHDLDHLTERSARPRRRTWRVPTALGVGAVCAVALAARLYEIGSQSMWLDEAVSSWYADQGLVALWSWSQPLDPYHPPGYYSLLVIWQLLGHSEAWLRSFSAVAGVAAIPFVFGAARRISGSGAGWVAIALLALAPLQVRFGQETRTYSLMVLEAAVILWSLTWILRYQRIAATPLRGNPLARHCYAYCGAMALALLSHNTSPLMWVTANLAVFVHWRLTPYRSTTFLWTWTKANLAVGTLWLVWFPVFVRQSMRTMEGGGHRKVPGVAELVAAFRDLSFGQTTLTPAWQLAGDALAGAAVVAALAAAVILARTRARIRRWAPTLLVFAVTAPAVAYGASLASKPVFLVQSLMWTSVPFFVLVGVLLAQLPRPPAMVFAAGLVAVTVTGLVAYYPSAHKEPWRDAAAYLRPRLETGDLVVYSADYAQIPMDYYLGHPPGVTQIGTQYLPPDLAAVRRELPDARQVWLVYAHEEFADPNRWVEKVLRERGDAVESRNWSEDIQIIRFLPRPTAGTGTP